MIHHLHPSLTLFTSLTSHSHPVPTTLPSMLRRPLSILYPRLLPSLHHRFHLSSGFRHHPTPLMMTPPSFRLLPSLQYLSPSLTQTLHSPCMATSSPFRTPQRLPSRHSSQITFLVSTIRSPSRPPSSSSPTTSQTPRSLRRTPGLRCSTMSR